MKTNLFKSFLLALVAAMLPQIASAHDFVVDGIYYKINGNNDIVTYRGAYDDEFYNEYNGDVNIPSSVTYNGTTYSVTEIGYGAFVCCTSLTSVSIPNSVTTISDYAFTTCTGLTSVTIGNSVTSIGYMAFKACIGLTSVTIPNSVTSVGEDAFADCSGLTSVTIPNSVTSIGNGAFANCSGLTSMVVESGNTKYDSRNNCNAIIETATNTLISGCKNTIIPNSVTSIGEWAFVCCTSLTSVSIPNSVTSIGNGAFNCCTGLTSVTIPNSVTSVGEVAFADCSGLTSVTIPNSVTSIGDFAFSRCTGLSSLTLSGKGSWYPKSNMPTVSQIKTVNIGSGITSLGGFSFTPEVVNCYAETPPACSSGTFSNYDGALHVPTTSVAAYFMADYWQNFNNMVNDLSKVTLDKSSASLIQWQTLALTATVTPAGDEVIWSSTNPWVATVDENGLVTATGRGECDIYATLASSHDAEYASCHITVSYPEISLSLSEENLAMNIGDEQTLTATIVPENTGLNPTWTTSDENVATVVNGKVIAIGEGECDIIATVLDKTATCHVTVTNNVTITLNVENAIIGASQMLTVYPSCSPDVPVELEVTSSDPSVVVARVVNRTNAPAAGLMLFPEKGMALAMMEALSAPSDSKTPALASTKAIMIVGAQHGTATITVTTADGKAEPAVLNLRVVDVDGDRIITASDITCLYNYMLNNDETYVATCDVDGDGIITSSDITQLYNLILGN